MNCQYCDEEIKLGPTCDRCVQLYMLISDTSMKVVENIQRDISVNKFMQTIYRRRAH